MKRFINSRENSDPACWMKLEWKCRLTTDYSHKCLVWLSFHCQVCQFWVITRCLTPPHPSPAPSYPCPCPLCRGSRLWPVRTELFKQYLEIKTKSDIAGSFIPPYCIFGDITCVICAFKFFNIRSCYCDKLQGAVLLHADIYWARVITGDTSVTKENDNLASLWQQDKYRLGTIVNLEGSWLRFYYPESWPQCMNLCMSAPLWWKFFTHPVCHT